MRSLPIVLSVLGVFTLACAGKEADDSPADDSPADDSAADDSSVDSHPGCDAVSSADDWYWQGQCPQMVTPCDLVVSGCTLSIDYAADGGMTMGMPYSGTIDGATVTFADDNTVDGCVGTVMSPDRIEGSCGSGCTFALRR